MRHEEYMKKRMEQESMSLLAALTDQSFLLWAISHYLNARHLLL